MTVKEVMNTAVATCAPPGCLLGRHHQAPSAGPPGWSPMNALFGFSTKGKVGA